MENDSCTLTYALLTKIMEPVVLMLTSVVLLLAFGFWGLGYVAGVVWFDVGNSDFL